MEFRPYTDRDRDTLIAMVAEDGLDPDEFELDPDTTTIMQNGKVLGFFTLHEEHGMPSVRHFFVGKSHRTPDNARWLVKGMRGSVIVKDHPQMIVHAVKDRPYIRKFVEYYFKVKPYAEDDKAWFYKVEV